MSRNVLLRTHPPEACAGRHCCIHNPSDHHMKDWDYNWREDLNLMERLCPHGVGHPDPDDVAYKRSIGLEHLAVHGCDGCCIPPAQAQAIAAQAAADEPEQDPDICPNCECQLLPSDEGGLRYCPQCHQAWNEPE